MAGRVVGLRLYVRTVRGFVCVHGLKIGFYGSAFVCFLINSCINGDLNAVSNALFDTELGFAVIVRNPLFCVFDFHPDFLWYWKPQTWLP